jgi:hypothetical protein
MWVLTRGSSSDHRPGWGQGDLLAVGHPGDRRGIVVAADWGPSAGTEAAAAVMDPSVAPDPVVRQSHLALDRAASAAARLRRDSGSS